MGVEDRRVMVTKAKLTKVADAIREKKGTTDRYELDDMPSAIRSIVSGGGSGYAIGDVINASANYVAGGVAVSWTDPVDIEAEGETLVEWGKTVVIRKLDTIPEDVNDGVKIIESDVRDQYKDTPFIDESAEIGNFYFYRFFIYTSTDVCTLGSTAIASPDISWTSATDAEIAAAVNAADRGLLDLHRDLGWNVGDERQVHIPALSGLTIGSGNFVNAQPQEQDITLVLMNKGGYEIVNPISANNHECSFVLGMKDTFAVESPVGDSGTYDWETSAYRKWLNENLLNNAFSDEFKSIFKTVYVKTATKSNALKTTEDTLFLESQREVLPADECIYISDLEKNALSTFEYYETPENRMRKRFDLNRRAKIATKWNTRTFSTYSLSYGTYDWIDGIKEDGTPYYNRDNPNGMGFIGCI